MSLGEAETRVAKGRAKWIEKGVSTIYTLSENFVDYSRILTGRCQWRPTESGPCGPTVMELL